MLNSVTDSKAAEYLFWLLLLFTYIRFNMYRASAVFIYNRTEIWLELGTIFIWKQSEKQ